MTNQTPGKRRPWGFVNRFTIPNEEGDIYLTRWGIRTPYGGVYIHRMDGPDSRSIPHDHPWTFLSWIIKGGYKEYRVNKFDTHSPLIPRWHDRWNLNFMRRDDAHFIVRLHSVPTWTVVFFGRRRRTWGFWEQAWSEGQWVWTEFDKTKWEAQRLEQTQ